MKVGLCVVLTFVVFTMTFAQKAEWNIQAGGGVNVATPSNVRFSFDDGSSFSHRAKWRTEPLKLPPYWDYRLEYEKQKTVISLRMSHLKLIMDNPSSNVEYFEVTHGLNTLQLNYGQYFKGFLFYGGAGLSFAHPESKVRGMVFKDHDKGAVLGTEYKIAGPNLEVGISKRLPLSNAFFVNLETRVMNSWVNVPVYEGRAKFNAWTFHLKASLGFKFIKNK